jgi:hypothetical protein
MLGERTGKNTTNSVNTLIARPLHDKQSRDQVVIMSLPLRRSLLRAALAVMLVAGLGAATLLLAPTAAQRREEAWRNPPPDWVVRVVTDERGNPTHVEYRWPIGRVDNIVHLRVPWGYRDMIFGPEPGAVLAANVHAESRAQGFASGFFVWALMPGLTPHDELDQAEVRRGPRARLVTIQIFNALNARLPSWQPQSLMRRQVSDVRDLLNSRWLLQGYHNVEKPGRYGLNRIGLDRPILTPPAQRLPGNEYPGIYRYFDLWFDGQTLESSTTIITCGEDEDWDGQTVIDLSSQRPCVQFYTSNTLFAGVQLSYQKRYLRDWQSTILATESLFQSFTRNRAGGIHDIQYQYTAQLRNRE